MIDFLGGLPETNIYSLGRQLVPKDFIETNMNHTINDFARFICNVILV